MSTNTLALIAVALMSAAVGAGGGLFAAFPVARRDARQELAPVTPRAVGRVVEADPVTPSEDRRRPTSLADWPVNKVATGMDNKRDASWPARNLVEPLASPYIGDTADITQVTLPVNRAGEQTAEQFSEQPNAALLPAARMAGRLAAAVRRWVQGRRTWWRTATAQWQDTAPGQHRNDRERAAGGIR